MCLISSASRGSYWSHLPLPITNTTAPAAVRKLIDVIREHHGNTLIYYFYCKQVEQMGGDTEAVDEAQFRYPGPKPRTKESAIIMMADTVEAASRSLEEVNEDTIAELVNRLIGEKQEDGQFDECQLSFKEFQTVKQTMIKSLAVARHLRIRYPARQPQNLQALML